MKRIFSILLVAIMLFSTLAIGTQAQEVTTESAQNKLTDELKAYLETVDDDEYVPIYIWLNEQSEDMVYLVLSDNLGMSVTKSSEESYITTRTTAKAELLSKGLENLAKTPEYSLQARATGTIDIVNLTPDVFRAQANIPEIMTNDEIKNCIESGMTSDEIINLSERTQFLSEYRTARKSLNNATNEQFYKLLDLDKCKNVYLDSLLAYVRMDCKKSYIDNLSSMSAVKEIDYFEEISIQEQPIEQDDATRADSTPADITTGYDMFPQNTVDGVTYTGAGIKVGVVDSGLYDTGSIHLQEKSNEILVQQSSGAVVEAHTTAVLSIICGKKKQYENVFYQGVAPGVSIFLSTDNFWYGSDESPKSYSLEWLIIDNSCHVVNLSMVPNKISSLYGTYSAYDEYIDNLILQYRVVFVKSAGNEGDETGEITNPGMAYNAITVGNADSTDLENGKYKMYYSSSFLEDLNEDNEEYLTNKPDLSAFGRRIRMLNNDGIPSNCFPTVNNPKNTDYVTGTSFAAPMVAGTVALMMQARPELIGNPTSVKAILMNSADEEAIYYNDTEGALENELVSSMPTILNTNKISLDSTILREKSGAGLLNIPASIRMAQSDLFYYIDFDYSPEGFASQMYRFNAGTTVEFGVVSEKIMYSEEEEEAGLDLVTGYDFELQIIDSTGQIIFKSTDVINNAKLYKCTFDVTGNYTFRIVVPSALEYLGMTSATFILSCGCAEKAISRGDCIVDKHTISCANSECGFSTNEYHDTTQITKSLSNGMSITLMVYYCPQKLVEVPTTSFDYYTIDVVVNVPNGYTCHRVDSAGYNVTQTWTGEIRTHTFEAIIEAPNANGMVDFITFPSITITIDYYEQTVTLS